MERAAGGASWVFTFNALITLTLLVDYLKSYGKSLNSTEKIVNQMFLNFVCVLLKFETIFKYQMWSVFVLDEVNG